MDVLGVSPSAQCHFRLQEQIDPLTFRLGYDRFLPKPPTPLSTVHLPPLVDWSLFPPAHWCPNPEPLWHPNNTNTFILKQVCDFTLTSEGEKKFVFAPRPPALRFQRGLGQWHRCPYRSAESGRALNPAASSCLCRPWTSGRSSLHVPSLGFPSHYVPEDDSEVSGSAVMYLDYS